MPSIILRPADPERDFAQLAAWFTLLEDEPASEASLTEWYAQQRPRIHASVAQDGEGQLLGFFWTVRDRLQPEWAQCYLFVRPEWRGQGMGGRLYDGMVKAAEASSVKGLRVSIWDTCPEGLAFATRRGLVEKRHSLSMALDRGAFDDRHYDGIIAKLEAEGFRFTTMAELGDTEEAQRRLYALNDATGADIPGHEGEHDWPSFADFQARVCRGEWYKPGGQFCAIDTATGAWAAMCAITRREGNDYAYILHTGVDRPYRGRRLAQAVRVLALRYARNVLGAHEVRTHHNAQNAPIIAISRKMGFTLRPGTVTLEKLLAR